MDDLLKFVFRLTGFRFAVRIQNFHIFFVPVLPLNKAAFATCELHRNPHKWLGKSSDSTKHSETGTCCEKCGTLGHFSPTSVRSRHLLPSLLKGTLGCTIFCVIIFHPSIVEPMLVQLDFTETKNENHNLGTAVPMIRSSVGLFP